MHTFYYFFIFQLFFFLIQIQGKAIEASSLADDTVDSYVYHLTKGFDYYGLKDPDKKQAILSLFLKAREQEKNFPEAYSFFTAQDSSFFAYQVIAKELYEQLEKKSRVDFEFLRYPSPFLIANRQEFFEKFPALYFNEKESLLTAALLEKSENKNLAKEQLADVKWEIMLTSSSESREKLEKEKMNLETVLCHFEGEVQQLSNQLKTHFQEEIKELETINPTPIQLKRLEVLYRRLQQLSTESEEEETQQNDGFESTSDVSPDVSRQLISVSYSMATCVPLDSAFFVFMTGKGVAASSTALGEQDYANRFENCIRELFEIAGISPASYQPYLEELIQSAPHTDEGILNQIFIPQSRVKDFFYPSFGGGTFSFLEDQNFQEMFSSFQQETLRLDFDRMVNKQGRLIAGTLFDEEVKIFRYSLIPEGEQEAYQAKVKKIVQSILR